MPKKSKEDFKKAFKAIKKPDRPKRVPSKLKGQIETAMDRDDGVEEFGKLAAQLYQDEPGYFVDLVAYKFAKHFDDGGNEKPYWVQHVPKQAFAAALQKVVPGDLSERLTQVTLEKSVTGGGDQSVTGKLIYARDPEATTDFALKKYSQCLAGGDQDTARKWAQVVPTTPDGLKLAFNQIAVTNNSFAARFLGDSLTNLVLPDDKSGATDDRARKRPIDHDALYELAEANPKLFAADVLRGTLKGKDEFAEIVTNQKLQTLLKKEAPQQWQELVKETPVLAVVDNVGKKIASKKLGTDGERVGAMFDAIMNNEGIPLAYYTNNLTPNHAILSGGSQWDKQFAADQKQKLGADAPDLPATQCHKLLHLTTELMNQCPGLSKPPDIIQDTCKNMLLTAPLASIPGKGLLDKSFPGNVFDDGDKPTGQILFTGDSGKDSHTWLVIDGVPFDPVLGTRGDQVAASIQERFDWLIVDRVARGAASKRYIVKGAGKDGKAVPKAASNKMGFISGYRITERPEIYLEADELEQAGIKTAKATVEAK